MNEAQFWEVIEQAHRQSGGDMDAKCEAIRELLAQLSADEAKAFSAHFDTMMDRAYSWALWGAAYVINGGCSDDTFNDFRSALISRGREAFEAALADPDSLAGQEIDEDAWFYEGVQYAVSDGLSDALGERPPRQNPHPDEPAGQPWDEDELDTLYPRLAEQFS